MNPAEKTRSQLPVPGHTLGIKLQGTTLHHLKQSVDGTVKKHLCWMTKLHSGTNPELSDRLGVRFLFYFLCCSLLQLLTFRGENGVSEMLSYKGSVSANGTSQLPSSSG